MADLSSKVGASEYLLFIDPLNGTDYNEVVCLTDHNFTSSNSTNSKQTYCGPMSTPGDQTNTIALNGVMMRDVDNDEISAPSLFDLIQGRTTFSWKIGKEVPGNTDITKSGHGYFSAYNENYSASDVASFGATITIDGDVLQLYPIGS